MGLSISRESVVEFLKLDYPEGTRVKLLDMDDEQAPPVGTLGTVDCVDDMGNIRVNWDNGSSLSVIFGVDRVVKVVG